MRRLCALVFALATVIGAVVAGVACSADDIGVQPADSEVSETAPYCSDLVELMFLLDEGGTVAEYNALLTKIVEESPVDHTAAWTLMLTLSEEPFTYENYNPAVDALERIDLNDTCAGLERLVVDDSGRVRRF